MTSWRISAWTHPLDPAGYTLREHAIPAVAYSGNDPDEPRGRCTITVPETYDWRRLLAVQNPTDPADTSMIRLYRHGQDNTTEPDVEYLLERFKKRITDDGEAVVDLYGVDWRLAGLDTTIVRPWDWTPGAVQTKQADWSYGGDDQQNLLENLDFRSTGVSEKQQYHLHASSGFYTITVPSFGTTGNLQPYEAGGRASDVETALEAIAGINDVVVTGKGHTQNDPLLIEFVDPLQDFGQITINDISLVKAGCAHPPCHNPVVTTVRGGTFDAEPWETKSRARDGNVVLFFHGFSTFAVIPDPVLGDPDKALEVTPTRSNSGVQQIVQGVEEGFRCNASVDIYTLSGTDEFTLHIYDIDDNLIAQSAVTVVPASTWTTITIPNFTLSGPVGLAGNAAVWRVSVASADGASTPSVFDIRNPALFYGVAAAPLGVIAGDLLDDAQLDHQPTRDQLPYITKGAWSDTLDSSAVAWPQDEHLILRRGKKYGTHIFGSQFADLGYEYDLVPDPVNPDTANWLLEVWAEGNRGGTITGEAFHVGLGVAGGLVAGRMPKSTRILAEGAEGILAEAINSPQETETGVVEDYIGDPDITDTTTLLERATFELNSDLANRLALTVDLDDAAPTPYADFDVADTAQFAYAGNMDTHNRRISEISLRAEAAAGGELHWTSTITASKLFTGQAANNEAIYRLLTAFGRFPQKIPKPSNLEGIAGGKAPTVVVAASDASDTSKAAAHYVCDGINDEDVIQAAIDSLPFDGGRVLLTEGDYQCNYATGGGIRILNTAGGRVKLQGMGHLSTRLNFTNANAGTASYGVGIFINNGAQGCSISDLEIADPFGDNTDFTVEVEGGNFIIERVEFDFCGNALNISYGTGGAEESMVRDCWFQNTNLGPSIRIEEAGINNVDYVSVTGCMFNHDATGAGNAAIDIDNSDAYLIANNFIISNGIGIDISNTQDRGIIADNWIFGEPGILVSGQAVDLIIDGNTIESSSASALEIGNNGVDRLIITNNKLESAGIAATDSAIEFGTGTITTGQISGNIMSAPNGGWGIYTADDILIRASITDNHFYQCNQGGIRARPTGQSGLRIADNTFYETPFFGTNGAIDVASGSPTGDMIQITGNTVMLANASGIVVGDVSYIQISDNLIYQPNEHGITLTGTTHAQVHDNLIYQPGQNANNTYDGILLQTGADDNWIYDNKTVGSSGATKPRYGLNISTSDCDRNRIGEHEFGVATDYGTGTYNNAGTGTIEHDTIADPADTAQVTTTTVANTVTETEIASLEIPQGDLVAGRLYRLSLWGDYLNNSGAPRQITIRVKLNGTTALTAVIASINAGANRRKWHLNVEVLGETTTAQRIGGFWRMSDQTANTMSVHANSARQATGYNTGAQDTTAGVIDVSVTAQHGTAAATIDIRRQMAKLERV